MTDATANAGTKGRRKKAAPPKADPKTNGADANTDATEADLANAEADAEQAKKLAQEAANAVRLAEIAVEIEADMASITEVTRVGDKITRVAWCHLGDHLLEIRRMWEFDKVGDDGEVKSTLDNVGFKKAIETSGIEKLIPNRNNRTDAMWLAEIANELPDLYTMIDDVSEAFGSKSFGHPKSVREWYRKEVNTAVECAVAYEIEPGDDAFDEALESLTEVVASGDASADEMAALKFLDAAGAQDFDKALAKYKPAVVTVPFKERSVEAAADGIVKLLATHPDPVAVAEMIPDKLNAVLDAAEEVAKAKEDAKTAKEAEKNEKLAAKEAAKAKAAADKADKAETTSNDETSGDDVTEDDEDEFPTD